MHRLVFVVAVLLVCLAADANARHAQDTITLQPSAPHVNNIQLDLPLPLSGVAPPAPPKATGGKLHIVELVLHVKDDGHVSAAARQRRQEEQERVEGALANSAQRMRDDVAEEKHKQSMLDNQRNEPPPAFDDHDQKVDEVPPELKVEEDLHTPEPTPEPTAAPTTAPTPAPTKAPVVAYNHSASLANHTKTHPVWVPPNAKSYYSKLHMHFYCGQYLLKGRPFTTSVTPEHCSADKKLANMTSWWAHSNKFTGSQPVCIRQSLGKIKTTHMVYGKDKCAEAKKWSQVGVFYAYPKWVDGTIPFCVREAKKRGYVRPTLMPQWVDMGHNECDTKRYSKQFVFYAFPTTVQEPASSKNKAKAKAATTVTKPKPLPTKKKKTKTKKKKSKA